LVSYFSTLDFLIYEFCDKVSRLFTPITYYVLLEEVIELLNESKSETESYLILLEDLILDENKS
jgi:hypothetical protein